LSRFVRCEWTWPVSLSRRLVNIFVLLSNRILDTSKALFSIGERYLIPKQADSFKLRMINTGFEMLSAVTRLDGKKFNVTATDGRDLEPMAGHVLVLGVGETYDINVPFSKDQQTLFLRFWLPVDHIGKTADNTPHKPFLDIEFKRDASVLEGKFKTELFMRKPEDPILKNTNENSTVKTVWINCPGPKKDLVCKTVSDFKRLESSDNKFESEKSINTPSNVSPFDEPDVILNIHVNFLTGSSINGIHFKYPTAPLFNETDSDQITKCSKEELEGAGGFCTQVQLFSPPFYKTIFKILKANVGDLVELRLSNLETRDSLRTYHSIHLHGYEFFLMAIGYAKYEDGQIIGNNEDISCANQNKCPFVDFNEEVLQRQRQNRVSFIAKNAILVPPQGYAIVRFRLEYAKN